MAKAQEDLSPFSGFAPDLLSLSCLTSLCLFQEWCVTEDFHEMHHLVCWKTLQKCKEL